MSASASSNSYRPDIDGLRSIAVGVVLIFHAGNMGFSGGFVGVDVFFVISGFLITRILDQQASEHRFSALAFYERRLRRLFPALLSTCLLTLAAGLAILSPQQLQTLASSAVYTALSVANFQYLFDTGYWGHDAETQPLLHTWSLSVEEQFYFIWPFVILALHRWKAFRTGPIIALLIVSLLASEIAARTIPSAAYFMTPFRFFEFLIGALCVTLLRDPRIGRLQKHSTLLYVVGLGAIFASSLFMSSETVFPGLAAAVPSVGTALIILADPSRPAARLLNNPVAIFLGKISYSLYLIHWPVFVLYKIADSNYTLVDSLIGIVIILVLSTAQYYWVEDRFRHAPKRTSDAPVKFRERFYLPTLTSVAVLGLIAAGIYATDGLRFRYGGGTMEHLATLSLDSVNQDRAILKNRICGPDRVSSRICGVIDPERTNILIVGDSFGVDGLNLTQAAFPSANLLIADHPGCPLLRQLDGVAYGSRNCADINAMRFPEIEAALPELDYVVLSQRTAVDRIEPTVDLVNWFAERDARLVVLGAGPRHRGRLVDAILQAGTTDGIDGLLAGGFETEHYAFDERLEPVTLSAGGIFIPKRPYFCPTIGCHVMVDDMTPTLFDGFHLTLGAAQAFGDHVRETFGEAFEIAPGSNLFGNIRPASPSLSSRAGGDQSEGETAVDDQDRVAGQFLNTNELIRNGGSVFQAVDAQRFVFTPSADIAGLVFTRDGQSVEWDETGVLRLSGQTDFRSAGGRTGGIALPIAGAQEAQFSGHRIRIEADVAMDGSGTGFEVVYSTSEVGTSGWQSFEAGPDMRQVAFEYDVPAMEAGRGDFLGFRPPPDGALLLGSVTITIIDP